MANIIEITDFSAPELDVYARLTENQLLCRADPSQALFIAESGVRSISATAPFTLRTKGTVSFKAIVLSALPL